MARLQVKFGLITMSLLFIIFVMSAYVPATAREPLSAAMEATGAQSQGYSMNAWMKLPEEQVSDKELQNMVEEAMEQLGINPGNYEVVYQQRGTYRMVRAESIGRELHAVAIGQVVPIGQKFEVYLVVNVESALEKKPTVKEKQQEITQFMQKKGGTPRISTCLMGWLDGKLKDGEGQAILQKAFMTISGDIIDKLELEHFVSYTGFSPQIEDWLQVGDKRVNINMAMRYSQYDNRTYVTIGSPIITREY